MKKLLLLLPLLALSLNAFSSTPESATPAPAGKIHCWFGSDYLQNRENMDLFWDVTDRQGDPANGIREEFQAKNGEKFFLNIHFSPKGLDGKSDRPYCTGNLVSQNLKIWIETQDDGCRLYVRTIIDNEHTSLICRYLPKSN